MRITILTAGSRGDVQPYVGLGVGLQRAGHQVCILDLCRTECLFGRRFAELGAGFQAFFKLYNLFFS